MQSKLSQIRKYSNSIIKKMGIGVKTTNEIILERMEDVKKQPIHCPMEKRIASRICCILGGIIKWREEKWINDKWVKLLKKLGYFTN